MVEGDRWRVKVGAWLHDPAEKALVLFRDPAGHEGGTVAVLARAAFGEAGITREESDIVRRADWWASAADRPQFPRDEKDHRYASWAQVRFASSPVLIHPLSGERFELGSLEDVEIDALKAVSLDHLRDLICRTASGETDWRRSFLSLWRRGPTLPAPELGALWTVLPADTRIPDHSIWEHLRLVSALAGAMHGGGPVLLSVSLGPVQSFIAQGRSTSDLWAGSHLLSRMAWEAMRVVCESCGPDAILFPDLHGVPLVDLWLKHEGVEVPSDGPRSDAHPLFAATLPNRFVAVVSAEEVDGLVERLRSGVRKWVRDRAESAWAALLEAAGLDAASGAPGLDQIDGQLAGFPEIHWAAVPWSLVSVGADGRVGKGDVRQLARALDVFYPDSSTPPGFLGSEAWRLLSRALAVERTTFYEPFPGVLYPALFDLLDRTAAAAKSTRTFLQSPQVGYRCSLCGEREWLTVDRDHLSRARGSAAEDSVWGRAGRNRVGWVRGREHLCAVCTLKRVWPMLFCREVRDTVDDLDGVQRYVVSTHTMALASTLAEIVANSGRAIGSDAFKRLQEVLVGEDDGGGGRVALPRRLAIDLHRKPAAIVDVVRRLPAVLDDLRDRARDGEDAVRDEAEKKRHLIDRCLASVLEAVRGERGQWKAEAYYALLLMDGDRMGAWLSGSGDCRRPTYESIWHPSVRQQAAAMATRSADLEGYLQTPAPPSPAYHTAISRALNGFSGTVARFIVEDVFLGKVIYAGGDDLLAMVSVDDLLPAMLALRCAYSGVVPNDDEAAFRGLLRSEIVKDIRIRRGYVQLQTQDRQLLRMMGKNATASIGAVVAHHMAPLGKVLRELRAAERRAKKKGGRDAFSIALAKRSGGTTHFTSRWRVSEAGVAAPQTPIGALLRLSRVLNARLSRRAAYHMSSWLAELPPGPGRTEPPMHRDDFIGLLRTNLSYQMRRQRKEKETPVKDIDELAADLAGMAVVEFESGRAASAPDFLRELIGVAEFLARAERGGE
ncbi:type III-B CRISPR-associated protein Cas10/Cmr2 [Candidatus Binatia bacterium]|nr:type III-B CRISPR-associated protein Cas10/Cmr2 [Candidatus Binatia bacterium]